MTCAHCFNGVPKDGEIYIFPRDTINLQVLPTTRRIAIPFNQVRIHPKYSENDGTYDIAVITLHKYETIGMGHLDIIPNDHKLNTYPNKNVTVYGYGTFEPGYTDKLTYSQFKYFSGSVCKEKYFHEKPFDTTAWMCFIRVDSKADVETITDNPEAFGDTCKFAFK